MCKVSLPLVAELPAARLVRSPVYRQQPLQLLPPLQPLQPSRNPKFMPRCWPDLDCWDLWQVAGSSNPLKSNFAAPAQTPLRRGFSRNIERTIRASSFWSGHNTSITPCPPPPSASQNCETAKAATELVVFLHPMLGSR